MRDSGEASKYRDPRADALRLRYHELNGGEAFPGPLSEVARPLEPTLGGSRACTLTSEPVLR
jgi:hypothetical protein